jgi:chromosome segregation ATPase
MPSEDTLIKHFTTRVRQLILQFDNCRKENAELAAKLVERERRIKSLEQDLEKAERDYQSLKATKMLVVTDGDVEAAKARLSKLIREVNKCITLLSEK